MKNKIFLTIILNICVLIFTSYITINSSLDFNEIKLNHEKKEKYCNEYLGDKYFMYIHCFYKGIQTLEWNLASYYSGIDLLKQESAINIYISEENLEIKKDLFILESFENKKNSKNQLFSVEDLRNMNYKNFKTANQLIINNELQKKAFYNIEEEEKREYKKLLMKYNLYNENVFCIVYNECDSFK